MALQPIKKQLHMNPYDYHKYLINEYVLKKAGDTRWGSFWSFSRISEKKIVFSWKVKSIVRNYYLV